MPFREREEGKEKGVKKEEEQEEEQNYHVSADIDSLGQRKGNNPEKNKARYDRNAHLRMAEIDVSLMKEGKYAVEQIRSPVEHKPSCRDTRGQSLTTIKQEERDRHRHEERTHAPIAQYKKSCDDKHPRYQHEYLT